jgi:hypothetical protein
MIDVEERIQKGLNKGTDAVLRTVGVIFGIFVAAGLVTLFVALAS